MSASSPAVARPCGSSLITLLVAGALFMEDLDGSIIATALPQMAHSFHIRPVELSMDITSYLLTLAVFIPISGWIADRIGVRSLFTAALAIFTGASVLCGLTDNLVEFTGAQILQGIGGAMMVPVGRLAVLRVTPKENLMRAISIITWPGLVAPVLGPPLGGFITTYSSWRWVFYLNVPLGLAEVVLAWRLITAEREPDRRPFDVLGFVLTGAAGTSVMYAMEAIGRADTSWPAALAFLTIGLAACAAAWCAAARTRCVALSALRIKTFTVAISGGSLFRIAIGAVPFLLPLMFQVGFGMNPFQSGLLTLAVFAGNLSTKLVTTQILRRVGFRKVLVFNGAFAAVTLASMSLLTPSTSYGWILFARFVSGVARSLQFTAINTLGFADVPKHQMSGASTLSSTLGQMTMGMGVAAGAIALRIAAWWHGHDPQTSAPADFSIAFLMVASLSVIAMADVFALPPGAGAHVSGHRRTDSKF
ncbi:MFS transporter [Paraburkholderia domus]|uniref:Transport protein HsrA n=1 Tax=Paraburkholderia domus TaxID=2793075 RepID=A0A9N8N8J3_9BURK|nr:MFS transporter [Paraburkholderia domus]MBK5054407.1 MFS transporter [Burkholderia sp. R-70006]MBK5066093.1 MFS transporter [Burkholderia sp. R-70199]MBK5169731.1 MFS transporter [Burkholderia sp. R-70211]MBK5185432.1 MFS transporter [Burkholderia sp. R-69749]CAE6859659.1 putative transport protein HsrA [Paraburkholderia domus]